MGVSFARFLWVALALAAPAQQPPLAFTRQDDGLTSSFLQDGDVAAHVEARGDGTPRLVVAFPAGNDGVGLWFDPAAGSGLRVATKPEPAREAGGVRGVQVGLEAAVPRLTVRQAVLGSLRFLRDYDGLRQLPAGYAQEVRVDGKAVRIHRTGFDGRSTEARLVGLDGATVAAGPGGTVTLVAPAGASRLRFALTATTDEPPLTPLPAETLLQPDAAPDQRAREALGFLTYREKLLAGSWRYLTYFGRDTLLSLAMLGPVLQPDVVEAGLGAVLSRLGPGGEVAHEEEVGEFAAAHRRGAAMILDYKMIDEDFLLLPVVAAFRPAALMKAYREPLLRNVRLVLAKAKPFAEHPTWRNLIRLKPGYAVGNWRDSEDGLGGGVYPYDVNAALVPAALAAARSLLASGVLGQQDALAAEAAAEEHAWQKARDLFQLRIPAADASAAVQQYEKALGLSHVVARGEPPEPVALDALAIDATGRLVPILHSDVGFTLFFTTPDPAWLERTAAMITAPFPRGLATPAGIVVANPVYAGPALQHRFTTSQYHGTVIWSWQQELLRLGLARQVSRRDLPPHTRAALTAAAARLSSLMAQTSDRRDQELWTFSVESGHIVPQRFGEATGHATESNPIQLWSTVSLNRR